MGPQVSYGLEGVDHLENSSRPSLPSKEYKTTEAQEIGKHVGPQGSYGLEEGNLLKKNPRTTSPPVEDQTTSTQDKSGESMGSQGSYGL